MGADASITAVSNNTGTQGTTAGSVGESSTSAGITTTTGVSTTGAGGSSVGVTATSAATSTGGSGGAGNTGHTSGTTGTGGMANAATSSAGGTTGAGGAATAGDTTATSTTGSGGGTNRSEGCGKVPTITSGNGKQISVGGTNRVYNIKVPDDYDSSKPYRLIVGYHGASLSANIVTNENYYGLLPISQGSTIFVAPQGLPTGGPFGDGWSNTNGADVEFSRQLIAQLESDLCIDKDRIFAEGFSMGGSMAYAMACGAPDIIRAVAVHSGGPMSGCATHDTPVAYFMTHGTQDSICTYPQFGVPELQDFAQVNGCTVPNPAFGANQFEAALPNPTDMSSSCIEFDGCMAGYPVRSCLFVGDHMWNPGGPSTWVPGEVWDFFTQF